MFEHVGVDFYETYFRNCAELLTDDGVMMLHSIGRSEGPDATNPWIAKYIFPGGYIPALSEVLPAIERAGLLVCDIEILRLHYAETLKAWRERFMARREEAVQLYDERFARMWEFYLACSEMSFRKQNLMNFQVQLAKRQGVVPMTRNYIGQEEAKLRGVERGPAATAPDRRRVGLVQQAETRGAVGIGQGRLRQLRAQAGHAQGIARQALRIGTRGPFHGPDQHRQPQAASGFRPANPLIASPVIAGAEAAGPSSVRVKARCYQSRRQNFVPADEKNEEM